MIRPGRWRRSPRPTGLHQARPACSTRSPPSEPGCCWPRATCPALPVSPEENGLGPDDEPDYAREPGHLVLARVLLAQDRPGQALALLDRLHAAAVAQGRTGSLIETGALRALALAAAGDEAGAVTALAEALLLGLPAGLCAGLRRRGPADGRAARPAHRGPAHRPGGRRRPARRTWPGFSGPSAAGATSALIPALPAIVDPLTSRELEVLDDAGGRPVESGHRAGARGHPGHRQQGKLGAANRTEAVARARELSLIP